MDGKDSVLKVLVQKGIDPLWLGEMARESLKDEGITPPSTLGELVRIAAPIADFRRRIAALLGADPNVVYTRMV